MKKIFLNYNAIFTIIFLLIYYPYIINGEFIKDDWFLYQINKLSSENAIYSLLDSFSNRPLAVIFYFILSRLSGEFIFYFIINFLLLFVSYKILVNTLSAFFQTNRDHIIFICFFLLPGFSTTVLFSTGMQLIGNLSLLLWALSLHFQLKYLLEKNVKYLIFFICFISLIFLTYESSLPLLGISLSFIFFYKPIKQRLNKFYIIFFCLIITSVIVIFIQKFVITIFLEDISRFRTSPKDFYFIAKILIANAMLLINSFFNLFILSAVFIKNNSYNSSLIIHALILIFFYIYLTKNKKTNLKTKIEITNAKYLIIGFFLTLFLVALMHTLANTGVRVFGYNNRGLLAISYILPIFFLFIKKSPIKHKKIIKLLETFFLINFLVLILLTQYSYIEFIKFINKTTLNIVNYENFNEKDNFVIYFDDDFVEKKPIVQYLTPINNTFQFGIKLNSLSKNTIDGLYLNSNIMCNNEYFVIYINPTILNNLQNDKSILLIAKKNGFINRYHLKSNELTKKLNSIKNCSRDASKSNEFIKSFAKEKNLYEYKIIEYETVFVKFLIYIYKKYLHK